MAKTNPKIAAKKEIKVPVKEKPKIQPKAQKKHYLPRLLLFYGIFLVALAIINYLDYMTFDSRFIDAILLFSGLWIIKIALGKGSYNRRKDIVMKYI